MATVAAKEERQPLIRSLRSRKLANEAREDDLSELAAPVPLLQTNITIRRSESIEQLKQQKVTSSNIGK